MMKKQTRKHKEKSYLLPDLMLYSPTSISHFHKLQCVSFEMASRICISLLQVLSYRQLDLGVILDKNEKKCLILIKKPF
jgi:hypothetical protein